MLHAPAADAASGGLGWAAGVAEVAVRAVEGRDMEVGADSVDDGLFWLTTVSLNPVIELVFFYPI